MGSWSRAWCELSLQRCAAIALEGKVEEGEASKRCGDQQPELELAPRLQ